MNTNINILNKNDLSDLSGLIETMIEKQSNKIEKELRSENDTYTYSLLKIQTIKDYFAAQSDINKNLIIQYDDLEGDIISALQNAMYVQGLRDGINLLKLAAGTKIEIFKTDVV